MIFTNNSHRYPLLGLRFQLVMGWKTRSLFREHGEYEHGPPTLEPSGEPSCKCPYLALWVESKMEMVFDGSWILVRSTSTNSQLFGQVIPANEIDVFACDESPSQERGYRNACPPTAYYSTD